MQRHRLLKATALQVTVADLLERFQLEHPETIRPYMNEKVRIPPYNLLTHSGNTNFAIRNSPKLLSRGDIVTHFEYEADSISS